MGDIYTVFVVPTKLEYQRLVPVLVSQGFVVDQKTVDLSILSRQTISCHILMTGIGLMNTCIRLTSYLEQHEIERVIGIGIAGAYAQSVLGKSDIAIIEEDVWADFAMNTAFDFKAILGQSMHVSDEQIFFEKQYTIHAALPIELASMSLTTCRVQKVKGCTVSSISNDMTIARERNRRWNVQVESMEGAGLLYTANLYGKKALQIRTISNIVGVTDKNQWDFGRSFENLVKIIYDNWHVFG